MTWRIKWHNIFFSKNNTDKFPHFPPCKMIFYQGEVEGSTMMPLKMHYVLEEDNINVGWAFYFIFLLLKTNLCKNIIHGFNSYLFLRADPKCSTYGIWEDIDDKWCLCRNEINGTPCLPRMVLIKLASRVTSLSLSQAWFGFPSTYQRPWARSHLHSVEPRPSHVSFTAQSSCPHLRGNSSSLGTNVTIPSHLSQIFKLTSLSLFPS